jgi:uncharacterized membrane protein YheB (UPF0754 family)
MDSLPAIFIPVLCAIIGYSTNWLAIAMLFRPHREIRIAKFRLPFTPGLIPKERARLSRRIAETVSEHVLTPDMLKNELTSLAKNANQNLNGQLPDLIEWAKKEFDNNPKFEEYLVGMLKKLIQEHVGRLAGIFLDPARIFASIKEGLFEYISTPENQQALLTKGQDGLNALGLENTIENIVAYIAQQIPIKEMVEKKINQFEVAEAERIILSVVKRELNVIAALGGVLGFLIGLVTLLL